MVYALCQKTFLSLWSYPNPLRSDRKELCDVLVVCGNNILIFSVKQVKLGKEKEGSTHHDRWRRKAIENSVRQIKGAEKQLKRMQYVIRSDNTPGTKLPDSKDLVVHRIAVALGSEGRVPIQSGKFNGSFVHVLDEVSINVILNTLDTISDLTEFLLYAEKLLAISDSLIVAGGYEDLMGFYILNERKLPPPGALIVIDNGFLQTLMKRPEYIRKKSQDQVSYFWDSLIDFLREGLTYSIEGCLPTLDELEQIVRIMALENRLSRRILSNSFREWHTQGRSRSRICVSPKGITYVFLACPSHIDRTLRRAELGARCFVARGRYKDSKIVVGIATEVYGPGESSFDAVLLDMPTWNDDHEKKMKELVEQRGLFKNPIETKVSQWEYPPEDDTKGAP